MATKRVNRTFGRKKDGVPNIMAVDRISKLPDPVIHHILSFVPTLYAVRMSILSRRWRRVWYSIPALHFCDSDNMGYPVFGGQQKKAFYKFVEECVKHRQICTRYITDSVITRFKLDIEHYGDNAPIDKWFTSAVLRNVEHLNLSIKAEDFVGFYRLPEAVLNARSLTVLKLSGLRLGNPCLVSLPSLLSLSLMQVELFDEPLRNLMLGCPALEKFCLKDCFCLPKLQISSSTLKFLEIIDEDLFETIEVVAINLQSFIYDGDSNDINLSACKAIRSLSLDSPLNSKSLEDLICGLPLLESLTSDLHFELTLKHIRICGQHLKSIRLDIDDCGQENPEVTIEAPNLISFYYRGDIMCGISMNAPDNLLDVQIVIEEGYSSGQKYDRDWYINLIMFLSNFIFSWKTTVSLHVNSEEVCILYASFVDLVYLQIIIARLIYLHIYK
ncbi:F-box domain containing protein [Trema orientale]|uniref:F-box domain containing protein n=1 Tax=Trema orientale TaxID=63057 RepID=A0A2P5D630_TREOI|nr:F-box domain containing protein [Trema orientale]